MAALLLLLSLLPSALGAAITATSITVVRVGSGTAFASGVAAPVNVDEYTTAGTLVQTIPITGGVNTCTLSAVSSTTWFYDQEGIPSLAANNALLSFPCYPTVAGSALAKTGVKVAAVVSYTGSVFTTGTAPAAIGGGTGTTAAPNALRQVISDGTKLWWYVSSGLSATAAGLFYTSTLSGTTTTAICTYSAGAGIAYYYYAIGAVGWGFQNTALMYTDSTATSPYPATGGLNSFTVGTAVPVAGATGATLAGAVSYPRRPFGFVWQSTGSIWMTETAALTVNNIAQYTGSGTTWTRQTPTSAMLIESGTMIISIAGRLEACGAYMLYVTSPTTLYSYNTATNTRTTLATAPTNTKFRGVTIAPYTGTAPVFGGVTCSSSVTPASTVTSTPTPSIPPPAFTNTNLAVVRVGSGAAAIVAGTAQAVFIDQYTTSASQTAPVYSYPVTGSNACTLSATSSATWLYDQEGIPSLATTGAFLSFPCYSVAAGSALVNSGVKVAAVVSFNAYMSTSTTVPGTIGGTAGTTTNPTVLREVVSNGAGLWWYVSSGGSAASSGLFYSSSIGSTAAPTAICTYSTGSCISWNAYLVFGYLGWGYQSNVLMYTDSSTTPMPTGGGLIAFNTASPTTSGGGGVVAQVAGAVAYAYKPYGFVYASTTSIWMTETANLGTNNIAQYSGSGTTWTRQAPTANMLIESGTLIISIAGRLENCDNFMLYLSSPTTLYSYATATDTKTVLATAPTNTKFRGVTIAPYLVAPVYISCSNSPTPSTTPSNSPSPSNIPSPVIYWSLDETEGTVAADTGNPGGNPLNMAIGSTPGASWQPPANCVLGGCVYFDGTSGGVNLAPTSALPVGNASRSITAWVNPSAATVASTVSLATIVKWGSLANNAEFGLFLTAGSLFCWGWGGGFDLGAASFPATNRVFAANTWIHVGVTYSALDRTTSLYISGYFIGSVTPSTARVTVTDFNGLMIGQAPNPTLATTNSDRGSYWTGYIDEVRIYDSAIPASQMALLAVQPTPTASATASNTASISATASETPPITRSPSRTPTKTPPSTQTSSATASSSASASVTAAPSVSSSQTASPAVTVTSSSSTTPSSSQTASPSLSYGAEPSSTGTSIATSSSSPSGTASPSSTGASTGTPSTTSVPTGTPATTRSPTTTPSNTATGSPSGSASQTPASTPSNTRTAARTPTNTGTSSVTPTNTPSATRTPSSTPYPFDKFSLAVVRVGSGAAPIVAGIAQSVYVDEYSVAAGQSAPMQSHIVSGSNACSLSAYSTSTWLYDQEGIPSLSTNGAFVVFPCFKVAAGTALTTAATKVAAVVSFSALSSTSTTATISSGAGTATVPFALRTTVSDGNGVWWALQTGTTPYATMQYQALGTTSATLQCDYSNYVVGCVGDVTGTAGQSWVGSLVATSSTLYWTDGTNSGSQGAGIAQFSGLPTGLKPAGTLMLSTATKPFGFVFASSTAIWATETTALTSNNIALYTGSGTTWTRRSPTAAMLLESGTMIISLAGRVEGCGVFMLYATSPSTLYAYNTDLDIKTVIATAPTNTRFRGVTAAPYDGYGSPDFGCTPTATLTPASTSSSSSSTTASPSNTPSVSTSPTESSAATVTPSRTPASTVTPSQSSTQTPSTTSSSTASSSVTAAATQTSTPSLSEGSTPSITGTPAASSTSTPSGTAASSVTPVSTTTPANTATSSSSASASDTPASTPTNTRTGARTTTPSYTSPATATPTSTPPLTETSSVSATATPTGTLLPFDAAGLAVVRVGSGAAPIVAGTAQSVYIDSYSIEAGQSAPIQSIIVSGSNQCTLSHSVTVPGTTTWAYDQEGLPLLSTTGTFISLPCYKIAAGSPLVVASVKVAALVYYNSIVNTATTIPTTSATVAGSDGTHVYAMRNVASDGTKLWWSISTGTTTTTAIGSGLYYSPTIGSTSAPTTLMDYNTGSGMSWYGYNVGAIGWGFQNTALMYTDSSTSPYPTTGGLNSLTVGTTVPTAAATGTTLAGAVSFPYKPYGFVWASTGSIWMTETANLATNNIAQYTGSGTAWTRQAPTAAMLLESGTMIISIAGRSESCGAFVLYATSPTKLYSYNSMTNIKSTLAIARANTAFRGVSIAPYVSLPVWPSCTSTPSTTGTPSNTGTPSTTPPPTSSNTQTKTSSSTVSSTASNTASSSSTVTASTTSSPSQTGSASISFGASPSITGTPLSTVTSTATGTAAPSLSAAPTQSSTATRSATPSGSTTASVTSVPTSTPTSTVTPFDAFNLAVVRVGGGSTFASGVAAPVFVDEFSTATGQSAPVRSIAVSGTNACTLSAVSSSTWLYDQEGIPSLSTTGAFLTFPCYKVTAGTALAVTATKVAAIVNANTVVSTATTATISTGAGTATVPFALRTTVSDGNGVWWALQTGTTPYSTMQYQAVGTTAATIQCDYNNYNSGCVGTSGIGTAGTSWVGSLVATSSTLYWTDGTNSGTQGAGIVQFTGLPTTVTPAGTLLFGTATKPFGFVFASAAIIWATETSALTTTNIAKYVYSGATWSRQSPTAAMLLESGAMIISIAGRQEGVCGAFMLYATSSTKLYSYNTATNAAAVLATAPTNTVFRGVTTAPYTVAAVWPSCSGTPASTVTRTSTASETGTPALTSSQTGTPALTTTQTGTAAETTTQSPVPTVTSSATSSASSSETGTPATTGTPSVSYGLSASTTGTPLPTTSNTPTSTAAETPSPAETETPTPSSSTTQTPEATGTPATTVTPTTTGTPTPSTTPSPSFNPASVAVLRLGSGSASLVTGVAQPLFIDEFRVDGVGASPLVRSLSMGVGANTCSLAVGTTSTWLYDAEGVPTRSADGSFLVFPCYATNTGSQLAAGAVKVAGIVYNTADVDTSTVVSGATSGFVLNSASGSNGYPRAMRGIASDGVSLWWGSQGYDYEQGTSLAYTSALGAATIQLCDPAIASEVFQVSGCLGAASLLWSGALGFYGGALFYTDAGAPLATEGSSGLGAGLVSFGGSPPLAPGAVGELILASAYAPYGFVFAGPSNLWMTETADLFTNNIAQWVGDGTTSQGGGWIRQTPTDAMLLESGSSIISLAGRDEACGYFVLYATSPHTLYSYNTGTDVKTTIAVSAPRTAFRGVVIAPAVTAPVWPSCTSTPSVTPTSSSEATTSPTPSRSASPPVTESVTPPSTPTPTKSFGATPTGTGAKTMTPTPSGAKTASPTPSGAKTVTPVATSSPALTRTPTGTKSATNTPTHSKTGTAAATRSPTDTPAATRSKTGTAAVTRTKTATKSPASSKTSTAAATRTPASSKTATSTKSPAASKTAVATASKTATRTK